jgi:hypothetical protein
MIELDGQYLYETFRDIFGDPELWIGLPAEDRRKWDLMAEELFEKFGDVG